MVRAELERRDIIYTAATAEGTPTAVIILPISRTGKVHDRETRGYNPEHMPFDFSLNGDNPKAVWLNSIAGDWRQTSSEVLDALEPREKIVFGTTLGTDTLKKGSQSPEMIRRVLERADFAAQNVEEGRRLLEIIGVDSSQTIHPAEVAYRLSMIGREKTVLLSDGEKGAYIAAEGNVLHGNIIPTTEISTLGAGDGAAAGGLAKHLTDGNPGWTLGAAIANGASIVRYAGSMDGGLSNEELMEKVTKHEKTIDMRVIYSKGEFLPNPHAVSIK